MQAHGFVRNSRIFLIGVAALFLAACGGGGSDFSVGGSSSGSSNAVLAGTFSKSGASTRPIPTVTNGDSIFGAVDSVGNGFFADLNSNGPAIFSFESASNNGVLSGFFAAYAASGSNLGGGLTLQQGTLTGTVSVAQSGATQASATFANTSSGFSNTASIVLDKPALALVPFATSAGNYAASTGTAAVASSALSTSTTATYHVTIGSNGTLALTTDGGCTFGGGTAVLDGTFNIYALTIPLTSCSGVPLSTALSLNGLAVYLPKGGTSPLNGSALAADTLMLELDDSENSGTPKYALALLASRQP
jgi:hypothetical protein